MNTPLLVSLLVRESILSSFPQVGSLEGVYHFVHRPSPARSRRSLTHKHRDLMAEDLVMFAEQQVLLKRVKRYSPPSDAKWPQQWYLVSYGSFQEPCKASQKKKVPAGEVSLIQ